MCILAVVRAGAEIEKERLKIMFSNNDDGCGFVGVNTDILGRKKMKVYKNMEFEPFYKQLVRFRALNPESNMLVHFRIGTAGELSTFNCHPFRVNNELYFAHNGIISSARKDDRMNDTQTFNEDVLKKLGEDLTTNSGIRELIEKYIGYSKIAFLSIDNKYTIMNEEKGSWVDHVWYSNDSYKKRKYGAYYKH